MLQLAIVSRDFEIYQKLFSSDANVLESTRLIYAGDRPNFDLLEEAEIVLSEPDLAATFIQKCTTLRWLHSTWAGNNHLQKIEKHDYLLTATKGIFSAQMREYAFAYILFFHRKLAELCAQQTWRTEQFPTLEGKRLGIMGLGSIGCEIAETARAFGMEVSALVLSKRPLDNIDCYALEDINQFARHCDYIVNVLPETSLTIGKCNWQFFNNMRASSVFINAGRGSIIDCDQTIINALSNNVIRAAVLDVFVNEPLESSHPFYALENCYITNHSAAVSDPKKVYDVFSENLRRYQMSTELLYQHDFLKGY